MDLQKIIEDLVDTFLSAGDLSLQLREKGLSKEIKSDNTPVSNGDIEVNNFISSEISRITPDIPIISEETSENKDNSKLNIFWEYSTLFLFKKSRSFSVVEEHAPIWKIAEILEWVVFPFSLSKKSFAE